jgi:hypothetical protein
MKSKLSFHDITKELAVLVFELLVAFFRIHATKLIWNWFIVPYTRWKPVSFILVMVCQVMVCDLFLGPVARDLKLYRSDRLRKGPYERTIESLTVIFETGLILLAASFLRDF